MNRIKLSKNFYLDEFTRSETAERFGIDMHVMPGSITFHNLKRLCITVLQPLRDALGPVHILSGFRPKKLNSKIGGAKTSQHILGLAVDFVVTGYTPLQVAQWIDDNLPTSYDQLIHEFGRWVHASVEPKGTVPRIRAMTAVKIPTGLLRKPKTTYVTGLYSMDKAREVAA